MLTQKEDKHVATSCIKAQAKNEMKTFKGLNNIYLLSSHTYRDNNGSTDEKMVESK